MTLELIIDLVVVCLYHILSHYEFIIPFCVIIKLDRIGASINLKVNITSKIQYFS